MNFKESKPIFMQIADRIADEIVEGRYPDDTRIPSVREYCALVEVNINTAMRAFDYLQQRGIIYNRRGLGYFVAPGAVGVITDMRREQFISTDLPELFRTMRLLNISLDDIADLYRRQQDDNE